MAFWHPWCVLELTVKKRALLGLTRHKTDSFKKQKYWSNIHNIYIVSAKGTDSALNELEIGFVRNCIISLTKQKLLSSH